MQLNVRYHSKSFEYINKYAEKLAKSDTRSSKTNFDCCEETITESFCYF